MTFYEANEILCVNFEDLAFSRGGAQGVHIVTISRSIDVAKCGALPNNADFDLFERLLIESWPMLVFETLVCVDELAKVVLDA